MYCLQDKHLKGFDTLNLIEFIPSCLSNKLSISTWLKLELYINKGQCRRLQLKLVMFYNSIKLKFKLRGSIVRKTKVAPDEHEKRLNSTQFNSQF